MVRVFITGASGLLGSSLVPRFLARGYDLRCLVRPVSGVASALDPRVECIEGEPYDVDDLRRAIRGCDHVVHAASVPMSSARGPEQMWQVNALAAERVARVARESGVYRFLHVSSALAIGAARRPQILDEKSPFNLDRRRIGYIRSRRAGDLYVRKEIRRGLQGIFVQPTVYFGPGSQSTEESLLNSAAKGRIRAIPHGGLNIVDVRDVAEGCLNAMDFGRIGESYILGGRNLTHTELVRALVQQTGQKMPRLKIPSWCLPLLTHGVRLAEVFRQIPPPGNSQCLRAWGLYFWYSSRKAQEEIGYRSGLSSHTEPLRQQDWDHLVGGSTSRAQQT